MEENTSLWTLKETQRRDNEVKKAVRCKIKTHKYADFLHMNNKTFKKEVKKTADFSESIKHDKTLEINLTREAKCFYTEKYIH